MDLSCRLATPAVRNLPARGLCSAFVVWSSGVRSNSRLLLRRGSAFTAAIAIVAIPLIAERTGPRAEMFTVILFAAYLSILWQNYQSGRARLWLLPLLMIAWVNLHLGFIAGLALIVGFIGLELLEILSSAEQTECRCRQAKASISVVCCYGGRYAGESVGMGTLPGTCPAKSRHGFALASLRRVGPGSIPLERFAQFFAAAHAEFSRFSRGDRLAHRCDCSFCNAGWGRRFCWWEPCTRPCDMCEWRLSRPVS
jgi:hypothetical protein